jgi:hypothetical protein
MRAYVAGGAGDPTVLAREVALSNELIHIDDDHPEAWS